ncbi:MAG: hypothetical protein K8R90_03995 [Candidatus Cloacimonetes bacterium]|nr:hypothetical protein [Candidatus Cloacimonadota bacterium]
MSSRRATHAIFAFTLALLLAGCAGLFPDRDAQRQVREHLEMWRSFRIDGVVTIEAQGLALHKEAVLRKNGSAIRIDIIEGGLFAASGSVFATVYIDSLLVVSMMGQTEAQPLDEQTRRLLLIDDGLLRLQRDYLREIVQTRTATMDSLVFTFDSQYRIGRVQKLGGAGFVNLDYSTAGQLDVLELRTETGESVKLLVDKFTPGPVGVPPLPLPENMP